MPMDLPSPQSYPFPLEGDIRSAQRDSSWPQVVANLAALYGEHADFDDFLARLVACIDAARAARPQRLKTLDAARAADPDWFLSPSAIGYSAYVERFGGNLQGVVKNIPYLQRLGVRYLHLLPFWKARDGDNDGGFAVADFRQVRPDLGATADLAALTEALADAGIALCADFVLNHTSDDHPIALAALGGDARARGFYHLVSDPAEVAEWEADLAQVFPETAPGNFTWRAELSAYVWTTFYPFQWDLNWSNPEVFLEMASAMLDLANLGVEAFRLDSAAYLWKEKGGPSKALPQCHLILQALRGVCEAVAPCVKLKSEVIGPVAETAPFLGDKDHPECHLAYHAGLMTAGWAALAEGDGDLIRRVFAEAPPPPPHAGWITYVRCHDDIGWQSLAPQMAHLSAEARAARLRKIAAFYDSGATYARGVAFQTSGSGVHGLNGMAASLTGFETGDPWALARLRLLYGLAFAAGGLPLIYMGDELGQLNDPSYRDDPVRQHEGRWLHRPAFDAARAEQQKAESGDVLAMFEALRRARMALPPLTPDTAPLVVEMEVPGLLAFSRGADALCLFNFSGEAIPIRRIVFPQGTDVFTSRPSAAIDQLTPFGMVWLTRGPAA